MKNNYDVFSHMINNFYSHLYWITFFSLPKARKAVDTRNQLEKKVAQQRREVKEDHLKQLAQKARDERAGIRIEKS